MRMVIGIQTVTAIRLYTLGQEKAIEYNFTPATVCITSNHAGVNTPLSKNPKVSKNLVTSASIGNTDSSY